jgi:vacuolar-type H+-ATPase subunit F/Vma7
LRVEEASTPAQAGSALERLIDAGDAGVILVEQSLFAALPAHIKRGIERRPLPIVIPVPSAVWAARRREGEDYILDLLQRAIGYRVRLG